MEALRGADGASGPLARKWAPRVGDDELEAQENVDRLRKLRDAAKEAGEHLIGRTQQRMGLLDDPAKAQQNLDAAEARLKALKERTPEDRRRDFDASERLRKSIDGLSETIKSQQGGATAQKSSADGDGPFGGARVQTASLGSFSRLPGLDGGARIFGGPGGGSGPGYSAEQSGRIAPQRLPTGRGPRYTGGDFLSSTPGARVRVGPDGSILGPDDGPGAGRIPSIGNGAPRLPGMGASGSATAARGSLATNQQEAYAAARAEGLSDVAARALVANMSGESLRNPQDHHWDRKHMSHGIVQWDPQRAEAIRRKFGAYPKEMSVTDQTRAAIDEIRTSRTYAPTARALEGDNPSEMLDALVRNYERPENKERAIAERQALYRGFKPSAQTTGEGRVPSLRDADFLPNGAPRVLKPDSMKDAPGLTMEQAERIRGLRDAAGRRPDILGDADDERRKPGLDEDEAERRAIRDAGIGFRAISRRAEDRLTASAARAGIAATPKIDGSSVTVNVNKAGSETTANVSTEGPAFRSVQMRRGQTMEKAGGG